MKTVLLLSALFAGYVWFKPDMAAARKLPLTVERVSKATKALRALRPVVEADVALAQALWEAGLDGVSVVADAQRALSAAPKAKSILQKQRISAHELATVLLVTTRLMVQVEWEGGDDLPKADYAFGDNYPKTLRALLDARRELDEIIMTKGRAASEQSGEERGKMKTGPTIHFQGPPPPPPPPRRKQ